MICRSALFALVLVLGNVGGAAAQWTTAQVNAPRVQYRTFPSVAAGTAVSFHIYTPPQYDSQPERRFPVLYWLHGSNSTTTGISTVSNWFGSAMSRGDLPPMLVVFPNGWPNGMYCDAADGTRPVETVIMQELIPHVDATFRTIAERRGRILEGFSMGGYGTGRLSFKYSERFVAASMLGAGPVQLDFTQGPIGTNVPPATRQAIYEDVWNADPAIFFAASPWNLAQVNAQAILGRRLRLRIAVGESDAMLTPNAELHTHLMSLGIPHQWRTYPGVAHEPLLLMQAMGPANWEFYRGALAPCTADLTDVGDTGSGPDNQATVDDMIAFVNAFSDASGCPAPPPTPPAPPSTGLACNLADITDVGDTGAGPDAQLTVDDVIAFVNAFSDGC